MPGLAVSDRMEKFEPSPANRYKVALRTDSNRVVQFLYKMCDGASNIYLFLFPLNILVLAEVGGVTTHTQPGVH